MNRYAGLPRQPPSCIPPSLCLPSSPWCLPNKLFSLFWVHPENVKSTRTFPLCTEGMGRALVLSPLDTFRSSPHSYSVLCFTPVSDWVFVFFFTLEEKRWTPSELLCLFLFFRTSQSAWGQQKFCRVKTHFLEPSFSYIGNRLVKAFGPHVFPSLPESKPSFPSSCLQAYWNLNAFCILTKVDTNGNSLVVQWLGLHTSTAGGMGSIPSWKTSWKKKKKATFSHSSPF